mmetsp:Transcript_20169/g.68404  ORF Transcript_20169/g.68404 Transcript_20169/m.68404 type:complete len:333 (-) Transcript_20169:78-1076(-)
MVSNTLEQLEQSGSWWSNGSPGHHQRDRAVMLLVDRAVDALTPLMHDYGYQSVVNDLLDVEEGRMTYRTETRAGETSEVAVLLNENDDVWVDMRHKHIARVNNMLTQQYQEFMQTNSSAAELFRGAGNKLALTDMADALKSLPEFQETYGKLSMHINILDRVFKAFNGQNLFELSQLEQTLSTGVDGDNSTVRPARMLEMVQEALPGLTTEAKLRLLSIYIISQRGVSQEDRRALIQAAGLTPAQQQGLINLERLGVAVQQSRGGGGGGGGGGYKGASELHMRMDGALSPGGMGGGGGVLRPSNAGALFMPPMGPNGDSMDVAAMRFPHEPV